MVISSSNYSSAFKKHHSISPAEFRKAMDTTIAPHPFYADKLARFKSFIEYDQQIIIKELDDFLVIHERHIGNYNELGKIWLEFTEKYHDFIRTGKKTPVLNRREMNCRPEIRTSVPNITIKWYNKNSSLKTESSGFLVEMLTRVKDSSIKDVANMICLREEKFSSGKVSTDCITLSMK